VEIAAPTTEPVSQSILLRIQDVFVGGDPIRDKNVGVQEGWTLYDIALLIENNTETSSLLQKRPLLQRLMTAKVIKEMLHWVTIGEIPSMTMVLH
jgi:hypothetical protein